MYSITRCRRWRNNLRIIYVFGELAWQLSFLSICMASLVGFSFSSHYAYATETCRNFFVFERKFLSSVLFFSSSWPQLSRMLKRTEVWGTQTRSLDADCKTKLLSRAFNMDASLEQLQLECLNYVNLDSVKWLRVYISDQ